MSSPVRSADDYQSSDGTLMATGHTDGSVYIFSTETGRMPFTLPGKAQLPSTLLPHDLTRF